MRARILYSTNEDIPKKPMEFEEILKIVKDAQETKTLLFFQGGLFEVNFRQLHL